MPFVILEGPNGGGKSTLADRICPDVKLKAGPPTHTTGFAEWIAPVIHFARSNELVVADRWHLGEHVYPDLLRPPRQRIADDMELKTISRTLHAMMNAVCVWVMPSPEVIAERFAARGSHWQVDYEQAARAYAGYQRAMDLRLDDIMRRIIVRNDDDAEAVIAEFIPLALGRGRD